MNRTNRRRTRREPDGRERAMRAQLHAEAVEEGYGNTDKRTFDAWDVAADAWEEAGEINRANHIRFSKIMAITGKGYGYGISPPHGIFTKGTTMAYVKEMVRRTGAPYFDRGTVRFWGGDKNYGPYVGPGGVFFVQSNRAGVSIKKISTDWSIDTIRVPHLEHHLPSVRSMAQKLARGGS